MSSSLALPSQLTLSASLILYPLAFYTITPTDPSPSRFSKSREAISFSHCLFVSLLSIYELRRQRPHWSPPTTLSPAPAKDDLTNGANLPLITVRSAFSNSITALEIGYLLQDAMILILGARLKSRAAGAKGRGLWKEINWRVLAWHHAGIATALGVLQWYIARGREKGVLVIVALMGMNLSTLPGTVLWYLRNFHRSHRNAIIVTNLTYLLTYALCRIYLIYGILHIYGSHTGQSAVEVFGTLRLPCRLGTGTIGLANSIWLVLSVKRFVSRYVIEGKLKNKRP